MISLGTSTLHRKNMQWEIGLRITLSKRVAFILFNNFLIIIDYRFLYISEFNFLLNIYTHYSILLLIVPQDFNVPKVAIPITLLFSTATIS